jgi:diguanylate cyclase (GGDEF)-like protein
MKYLDRPTLSLVMFAATAVASLVMLGTWRLNRQISGVSWWLAGTLTGTFGLMVHVPLDPYAGPTGLGFMVGGLLLLIALLLQLEGTLRFSGRAAAQRWKISFVLVPSFLALSWIWRTDALATRILQDSTYAVLLATNAALEAKSSTRGDRYAHLLCTFFLSGAALTLGTRAVIASQYSDPFSLDTHPINSVVLLTTTLFVLGWTYSAQLACFMRAHQTIESLTREDSVTGLSRRNHLNEVLEQDIARSQRNGLHFSFLLIEVADLSHLNDEFGPPAQRNVLKALGTRLREFARDADFACPLGNDQFVILLHHTPNLEHLTGAVARLRQMLAEPIQLPGKSDKRMDFSIGMAMWPIDGKTQESLEQVANQRMRAEKFSLLKPYLNDQGASVG